MSTDKLRYDLALAYAKSKLDYALNANIELRENENEPLFVAETNYIRSEFLKAYGEFTNLEDSEFTV